MSDVYKKIVQHLAESPGEIPFTLLFTLRQLKREFWLDELKSTVITSSMDNKQKLRTISSISFSLPHELLPENDYLHFINAFEKFSQKLGPDNINLALITLADLRTKIDADNFDGLFSVTE